MNRVGGLKNDEQREDMPQTLFSIKHQTSSEIVFGLPCPSFTTPRTSHASSLSANFFQAPNKDLKSTVDSVTTSPRQMSHPGLRQKIAADFVFDGTKSDWHGC